MSKKTNRQHNRVSPNASTCEGCGKAFTPKRGGVSAYCSEACRRVVATSDGRTR